MEYMQGLYTVMNNYGKGKCMYVCMQARRHGGGGFFFFAGQLSGQSRP